MVRRFESLRVWQESMDLVEKVFEVSSEFPEEASDLVSEVRVSVIGVVSAICEGCGKRTDREFIAYLHDALGYVKAVKCKLLIGIKLRFLDEERGQMIVGETDKVAGMLIKFIRNMSNEVGPDEV